MPVYNVKPQLEGNEGGSGIPGYTFKCTSLDQNSTIVFGGKQLTFKSLTECEEYKIAEGVFEIPNVFGFINGSSGNEELISGFITHYSYEANLNGELYRGTIYQLFADTEMRFLYE